MADALAKSQIIKRTLLLKILNKFLKELIFKTPYFLVPTA